MINKFLKVFVVLAEISLFLMAMLFLALFSRGMGIGIDSEVGFFDPASVKTIGYGIAYLITHVIMLEAEKARKTLND